MERQLRMLLIATTGLLPAATAAAQVMDHLQCYRITDPADIRATVTLTAERIGTATGCTVAGAALFCTPAVKTVARATSNGTPFTPLPFVGPPAEGGRICYNLRCPPAVVADRQATDQFGTRTLTGLTAAMLCTPAVEGGGFCGNGVIDPGEQCDGDDLGGASCEGLGFAAGAVACAPGCRLDTSGCVAVRLPATGQTTCWDSAGTVVPCAGTGQDGDFLRGGPLAYVDNGDGTVTDVNTRLVWEKLAMDGSVHDVRSAPSWMDAIGDHVATLNRTRFAGHDDWRLPNYKELVTIVDFETSNPSVAPAFNDNCVDGCTVTTCSCTAPSAYWSSTSSALDPEDAWYVSFTFGFGAANYKVYKFVNHVRAVRGGS